MLFDPKKDSPEAALARAQDARAKLLAGADFGELARKVSDEPAAKTTGGELGWFGPGRLDPDFTKAAYAMKTPGEISEPLRTRFGYHVIRYEDRRPERQQTFDEVKDGIMAQLRATYVTEQKEAKLAAIRSDPNMKIDQAAVDGLVYHPDPQLFKPAPPPPTN
jgi:parvulin-like peptidyl-prolyl isomerase